MRLCVWRPTLTRPPRTNSESHRPPAGDRLKLWNWNAFAPGHAARTASTRSAARWPVVGLCSFTHTRTSGAGERWSLLQDEECSELLNSLPVWLNPFSLEFLPADLQLLRCLSCSGVRITEPLPVDLFADLVF